MNQKGFAVPGIIIVAGVIIVLSILATLVSLNLSKNGAKPSPSPSEKNTIPMINSQNSSGCADRDYTGCDGKEIFTWVDDGKR